MQTQALQRPTTDPTPIFEFFRGNYATELLTAAVSAFQIFERLRDGPRAEEAFRQELQLAERPAVVLFTALRAMRLLVRNAADMLELTPLAREHLVPGTPLDVSDYIGLAADSPQVQAMIERLRTNRPAGIADDRGAAFIYREGIESAMESEASARHLTLALAGRAKNAAVYLADAAPLNRSTTLLDIGGGTGLYSIAFLLANPNLRAVVWDRPEVLKVAWEMAERYGLTARLSCIAGDMFAGPLPQADVHLLSNILHDWDIPQCRQLVERSARALPRGGQLLIHDVFLNDDLDGPLPIALYSAALFSMTEGRAYSAGEYRGWMQEAGLAVAGPKPTLIHCGVMVGTKS